jgi:hypothetical protein
VLEGDIYIPVEYLRTLGKGKGRLRTGYDGPEGGGGLEVYLYSFVILDSRWKWVANPTPPAALPLGKTPGACCTGAEY